MIFKIEEAHREGARLVIGVGGISGGGKTFTALQLAWGMANGDASKVGLMCTENKRGRLYSDILVDGDGKVHRFMIGDLTAPFSPARYVQGIQAFVDAGVEILVIDSVTHEWEGIGGCEDIAHAGSPRVPKWNDAKREHKAFMNALLASPLHIVACMRAREKVKLVKGQGGKTDYESQGVLPIQEKNFVFELTASMMLWNGGKSRDILKAPADLVPVLGDVGMHDGYIGYAEGLAIRQWVDGGKQVDPEVQRALDTLNMTAEQGLDALVAAWKALPGKLKKAIGPNGCPENLKASASAFDLQRAQAAATGNGVADDLNDTLGDDQDAAE